MGKMVEMSRASKEELARTFSVKWHFLFLNLTERQNSLVSLSNMRIRFPGFGFITFVAPKSSFPACQVSVMQGSQEHVLRNSRSLVSREQRLSGLAAS